MHPRAVQELLPTSISDSFDSGREKQKTQDAVFVVQAATLSLEKSDRPRRRKSSVARLESREDFAEAFTDKKDQDLAGPSALRRDKQPRQQKPLLRKVQSRELDSPEPLQPQHSLGVRPMEESLVVSRLHEELDEGSREDLDSASHKRHAITIPVPHSRPKDLKAAEPTPHPDESPSSKNGRKEIETTVTLDGLKPKMLASLLGESLQDRLYLKSKLKKIDQTIETLKRSIMQQPNSSTQDKRARQSPAGETKDSVTSGYAKRELKTSKEARDLLVLRSSKSPTGSGRSDFLNDSKHCQFLRNGPLMLRGPAKQTGPLSNSFVLPEQSQTKAVSKRNQPFTLRKKRHFIIPADRDRDPQKVRREPAGPKPDSPNLFRPSSFDGRSVSVQPGEPDRPRPATKGWSVRTRNTLHRHSSGSRKESPTKEQFIIE